MLLKDSQVLIADGSYLSEEDNKFVLNEVKNGKCSNYISNLDVSIINKNIFISNRYELIRVNSYNPNIEVIEHDMHINGVYVYVPPKDSLHTVDKSGNVVNKYPTVIKFENILVFCSFDDLHDLLNKVLNCKETKKDFSEVLNCNSTKIIKKFWNLSEEKEISVEIELYNKCRDSDLMKEISPWIFVTEFIECCEIPLELINEEDLFWGVIEYNTDYYKPLYVWDRCYAVEMIDCYPTDLPDEKIPANVHRIMVPEENDEAIGVAYRMCSQMYELRVWIKIEEFIKKIYKKSNYLTKDSEIEECVSRHLSILREEERPLYYQLEKEVPPILFMHDRKRIISECVELLTDIVEAELEKHLYGV